MCWRRLILCVACWALLLPAGAVARPAWEVVGPQPLAGELAALLAARLPAVTVNGEGDAVLRIAVGARAFQAALDGGVPVVGVALTRHSYRQASAGRPRGHTALYWEPDPLLQLQLARQVLPGVRRVGVLLATPDEALLQSLQAAARQQRIELVVRRRGDGESLVHALNAVLADSDLLLALEDPAVFSPATAKTLLLTSYRHGKPVIGPGGAYVEAGSVASVAVSLADIADSLAAWLAGVDPAALPPPRYPPRYSVITNPQVARSLRLILPSADELASRLRALPGAAP